MKTQTFKLIFLTITVLFNYYGYSQIDLTRKVPDLKTARPFDNKLCNTGNVHSNFKTIVTQLSKKDTSYDYGYKLEVTIISPGKPSINSNKTSHYFTAWGSTDIYNLGPELCSFTTGNMNIKFSDRNFFNGKQDIVKYDFNPKKNEVKITLLSWGNSELIISNLKRDKNLLYHIDSKGVMTVFNFYPVRKNKII